MTPRDVHELRDRLSDRDLGILETLRAHRMASTDQIRRLHFNEPFGNTSAAGRATTRVLGRLEQHELIGRLKRRIGGVRRGSASIVWQLSSAGDRFLAIHHGEDRRRRYTETGLSFVKHTMAITELATLLHEAARRGDIELVELETEPTCWRPFLGAHGRKEILKPDLFAITATGGYEDHWFLEVDLGTEHPPVVARKALVYERFASTGTHQATHDLFPAAVWVVQDQARKTALTTALSATRGLSSGFVRVITTSEFLETISAGAHAGASP